MKTSFLTLFLLFAISVTGFAQTTKYGTATTKAELTEQEQQVIIGKVVLALRDDAVARMKLTPEQIIDFDGIYEDYVEDKQKLDRKRRALVAKYTAEMDEFDTVNDERKETADFIEDYWDLKIKEDELEKYFFGKFEKAISPVKALGFFALEDAYLKDIYRARLQGMNRDMMMLEPGGEALKDVLLHGRD